ALGIQSIESAGRQENGQGDAHGLLVCNELFVRASGIVGVLMDVDDWLVSHGLIRSGCEIAGEQQAGGADEKLAPGGLRIHKRKLPVSPSLHKPESMGQVGNPLPA